MHPKESQMNTTTALSRACAVLASALITVAIGAGIDTLASHGQADPRLAAAVRAATLL
jgi:hypothetical protein